MGEQCVHSLIANRREFILDQFDMKHHRRDIVTASCPVTSIENNTTACPYQENDESFGTDLGDTFHQHHESANINDHNDITLKSCLEDTDEHKK